MKFEHNIVGGRVTAGQNTLATSGVDFNLRLRSHSDQSRMPRFSPR